MRESDRLPPWKDLFILQKAMLFFGQWRTYFFSDADARGIHHMAEMNGDIAMRLFWERGTAPTVQAVLDRRMRVEPRRADAVIGPKLSLTRS